MLNCVKWPTTSAKWASLKAIIIEGETFAAYRLFSFYYIAFTLTLDHDSIFEG